MTTIEHKHAKRGAAYGNCLPGEDTAKPRCECLYWRANILTFVRNSYHYLTYDLETTLTRQKSEQK